jgi:uncharacterized protein YebE (UPF0316 family)
MTDFFPQGDLFSLIVVPALIFCARIADVTFGTLRIIYVSRGMRYYAALVGFFEILIWLLAIGQVMQNLNSPATYIAYGLGFSTGNFVGISLERKLAMGNLLVRVITRREADDLVGFLRNSGYGVTSVDARGEAGPVKLIFTVVKRKNLPEVVATIKLFNPRAFYTIEDVRFVQETAEFPVTRRHLFSVFSITKRK